MPIAIIDLMPDQYADFYPTFLWQAGTPAVTVDLTGASARMMVRQNPGDALYLLSISTTPNATGKIVLGGTAGTVQIVINKGKIPTQALTSNPPNPAHYDLLIDWGNGITTDFMEGQFLAAPGWTH